MSDSLNLKHCNVKLLTNSHQKLASSVISLLRVEAAKHKLKAVNRKHKVQVVEELW